jgi:hypothetical protein
MLRFKEWMNHPGDTARYKVVDILLNADDEEKIYLEFQPMHFPPDPEIPDCYDSFRVYKTDYDKLLVEPIASVFPVMDPNPRGWGLQEYFDICAPNFFGREDWIRAIEAITKCAENASEPEKEFYSEIITRMRGFLDVNDMYCIDGNL